MEDLNLMGVFTSGGGTYGKISAMGAGKITGDVECDSLVINGGTKVLGNLKAKVMTINGGGKIDGAVQCKEGTINGAGRICNNVTSDNFQIGGSASITGNFKGKYLSMSVASHINGYIHAERVETSGSVKVDKGIQCEVLNGSGEIKTEGMVNVEELNLKLYGKSSIEEIGAAKVIVERELKDEVSPWKIISNCINDECKLTVKVIEADEIYLESTTAEVVRGKKVSIGRNCHIKLVEYSESCEVLNESNVEVKRKIEKKDPLGL